MNVTSVMAEINSTWDDLVKVGGRQALLLEMAQGHWLVCFSTVLEVASSFLVLPLPPHSARAAHPCCSALARTTSSSPCCKVGCILSCRTHRTRSRQREQLVGAHR